VVAIVLNRPAQFGGSTSGLPVVRDFIHGTGTALSPSLVWMLAQALFTWLAWNQPAPSRIQAGMIIIPLAMMVFAIQEWRRRWSENQAERKRGSSEICVDAVSGGGQDHS
jgi:hypothetical protein